VIKFPQGDQIFFLNDYLTQNTYDPHEKKSLSAFTYMLHGLARVYTPKIDNVLCIGLGIGIVPMQFAREGAEVDVVEINPAVVTVARDFFDLEVDRLNISIADGRHFVNRSVKQYDTIILDAFLGDSSPSHLMTREAFGGMRKILQPEGTLVINCFGDFERGRDFFTASLQKTLLAVFKSVRIHATGNGNVFFVASDREELTMLHPPPLEGVPASLLSNVRQCYNSALNPVFETGRVLTDDYNPVEYYDALNRERFRRQTALFMKQI
jgi:spermidine synthase